MSKPSIKRTPLVTTRVSLADLQEVVAKCQTVAVAPSSRQKHALAWKTFNEFLNLHHLHNQYTQDNLLAYLARMVQLNFAPKTIIDEVSLFQKQLIIENLPDITQGPRVALFLYGLKKIQTELKQKDPRLPITIDILQAICDKIVNIMNSDYHAQLYRAMFLLAFHRLLRIGEITHRTEKPLTN